MKYLNVGTSGLHDYEIIELLLTYAIPLKDVKPIAKNLITRFKDINGVLDATHDELCEVEGISLISAGLISLVRDICSEYLAGKMKDKDALSSPEAVRDFARMKMAGLKDEAFMVIYLNTKNHVIEYEMINEGTVDQAVIYPRNIIKKALGNNATGLIVIHNHPSGMCEPSKDDVKLTHAIREAANTVNIKTIDHIIVGKSGYFSFIENSLL
jgi:DNA repair protein RadC